MEECDLCRGGTPRLIQTYWADTRLCPGCCIRTADTFDAKGNWPAVPWPC